ncbi:MAG TPA: DNA-formamidopyrimidine glycosylase family protein [Acidimicrobiales bacterium]|nr:DNA-formamidopyrimidine glycosylase family protein [Acidimicrobiales bacterium]
MPEGDTIFRAARSLGQWLDGRTVTAARTTASAVPAHKLVGQRVVGVEARAKHLLIRFDSGMVLHTHMRMTGAWHVYRAGERWRKPAHQARVVLEVGDRVAVCFNAPVVELLAKRGEELHPALTRLGPDVLVDPLDLEDVRRRLRTRPPDMTIGEALLDQQVVSGIGNIWRCEALFACRVPPAVPWPALDDAVVDDLVLAAARLMRARVEPIAPAPSANQALGPARFAVYSRTGRPCPRCRTPIATAKLGEQPRDVYWCPTCQPSP